MAEVWFTVSSAIPGFREILQRKCPKIALINFRYKLSRSLDNISFRVEMRRYGALLNWDATNNICDPPWTQETIEASLKAIETNFNPNEKRVVPLRKTLNSFHQKAQITSLQNETQNDSLQQEDQNDSLQESRQPIAKILEQQTTLQQETQIVTSEEIQKATSHPEAQKINLQQETEKSALQETPETPLEETEKTTLLPETQKPPKQQEAQKINLQQETRKDSLQQEAQKISFQEAQKTRLQNDAQKLNSVRPIAIMKHIIEEDTSEESNSELKGTPKLLIKTGYRNKTENTQKIQISHPLPQPLLPSQPIVKPRQTRLPLKAEWHNLIGENIDFLYPLKYTEISELIEPKVFTANDTRLLRHLLPFILQRIKLWRCNVLSAENLYGLLPSTDDEPDWKDDENDVSVDKDFEQLVSETENVLSRLDIFTLIIASTEITVLTDIFQNISKFPIALPMILPNPVDNKNGNNYVVTPALEKCLIRWEKTEQEIEENYLFKHSYKLITAIRLGNHDVGKSCFLNQLFLTPNVFHSRGQPGKVKPISLAGSVEVMWMTKDTCKDVIWKAIQAEMGPNTKNEIVLLANFHGDALQHRDVLQTMCSVTSTFIVFVMPDETNNVNKDLLTNICGKENLLFIYVDPKIPMENLKTLKSHLIFDSNETLNKLKQYIKRACKIGKTFSEIDKNLNTSKVSKINGIAGDDSKDFLDLVEKMNTEESQGSPLCLQKLTGSSSEKYWSSYTENENLQLLILKFIGILQCPLPRRRIALTYVEQKLAAFSKDKVAFWTVKLGDLLQKRNFYVDSINNSPDISSEISKIYKDLEKSLSLNDFLRELSIIFEITMIHGSPEDRSVFSKLPAQYAELLIEGGTLEILDGETGSVPGVWLEAVCHSVCEKLSNLKVYVVSILGLQSSGKSTLLNALFGCKFATSVGKCTKGLFMRLMLLEASFQKKLGLDAILVVDTEGLGSPESMLDPNAESKDRTMATFAMTISNLTLINVAGESNKEMVHILQIVILTMARMEKTDLSPDILLVQQVPEGGHENRLAKGVDNFCNALEEAVKVVQSKEIDLGVRTMRNLKLLKQRLQQREILYQLRPFKSGASPQSPPTEEYCQDVIGLRNRIIKGYSSHEKNYIYFCTWHKLLKSYWEAVQKENFALKFTGIAQVQEFIEVNTRMASVKKDLDSAFLYHQKYLSKNIMEKQTTFDQTDSSNNFRMSIHDFVNSNIDLLPGKCQPPKQGTKERVECSRCAQTQVSRKELIEFVKKTSSVSVNEIEENVSSYISNLQSITKARILRIIECENIRLGRASEFDTILNKIIRDAKKNMKIQSVDDVWNELLVTVEKIYPKTFIKDQIIEDIVHAFKSIPDVEKWKVQLEKMHIPEDILKIELPNLIVQKRKRTKGANKSKSLTTNEQNWLRGKLKEVTEGIVANRKGKSASYADVLVAKFRTQSKKVLEKFEHVFQLELNRESRWHALFYGIQIFLEMVLKMQEEYNREFEPTFILLKQKQEYLKKIEMYLILQSPTQIQSFGTIIAKKLLEAAVGVCLGSFNVGKYLDKWASKSENIRLRYLVSLAEDLKCGNEDIVLGHFQDPTSVHLEWYLQTLALSIEDVVIPLVQDAFMNECSEIENQVVNTKSIDELTKFLNWYLNKVGDNVTLAKVTEEMQEKLKFEIQKQMSKLTKDYIEDIVVENLPVNYDKFVENLGCKATCPGCSAMCWGSRDHVDGAANFKQHFTCHQPKGLGGVINENTNELEFITCWQDNDQTFTPINDEDNDGWLIQEHPIKEYNQLMQWFFLKLKNTLAKHFNATLNETQDENLFKSLDDGIDGILNVIRHKSNF